MGNSHFLINKHEKNDLIEKHMLYIDEKELDVDKKESDVGKKEPDVDKKEPAVDKEEPKPPLFQQINENDSRRKFKKEFLSDSGKSRVLVRKYCPQNNSDSDFVGEIMSVKRLQFDIEKNEKIADELIAFSRSQRANCIIPIYGILKLSGVKREILICAPLMEFSLSEIYYDYVKKGKNFPQKFLQYIAHILIDALDSINENGKAHGNIKPTNILFKLNGELQLCDYGMLYNNIYEKLDVSTHIIGTKYWSPERCNNLMYNESKDDLWAIGMTLTEAILGQHPYVNSNFYFLYDKRDISLDVSKMIREKRVYGDITIDFIKSCLFVEKKRPTIREIQDNPFYYACDMKKRDKLQKGIEKFLQTIQ